MAAIDFLLATVLTIRFLKDVQKGGFQRTNSLLIRLAISTLEFVIFAKPYTSPAHELGACRTFSLTAVLALASIGLASSLQHVDYPVSIFSRSCTGALADDACEDWVENRGGALCVLSATP